MPGPEARIEARLVRGARALGLLAPKFTTMERGWPDRLLLLPGGRVLWVEVKQPRGRLSPYQAKVHERLRGRGHDVRVVWSVPDVDRLLTELGGGTHEGRE